MGIITVLLLLLFSFLLLISLSGSLYGFSSSSHFTSKYRISIPQPLLLLILLYPALSLITLMILPSIIGQQAFHYPESTIWISLSQALICVPSVAVAMANRKRSIWHKLLLGISTFVGSFYIMALLGHLLFRG